MVEVWVVPQVVPSGLTGSEQVPVADRWAIVAYLRALQRSQYAGAEDVPPGEIAR